MPRILIRSLGILASLSTLLAVCPSAFAQNPTPVPVIPGSTFVPVSGFFDFIADNQRGLVYFSAGSQILRWRRSDQQWLAPIEVGGDLRALDISPNGATLAVADAQLSNLTASAPSCRVALINLNTLAVSNILFFPRTGENGTYSLAYDANGNLLIAPGISAGTINGSAFRIWNAATNQTSIIFGRTPSGSIIDNGIAPNTAIVADTNRSSLAFVEMGSSTGNWGYYFVTPGTGFGTVGTITRLTGQGGINGGNYPNERPYGIAPDSNSRFFVPTAGALHVERPTGGFFTRYGGPGTGILPFDSATYDSTRSLLYLTPSTSSKIEIRDPASFNLRDTLNAGMAWPSVPTTTGASAAVPYAVSRMRTTSDGTLLGARVNDGVRFYNLQNGLPAGPPLVTNALTTPEDTPYPFVLDSQYRTDPTAVYSIVQPPSRGTLTGTGPNFTYTPGPNYNGSDFFAITVNGVGRGINVTVTPVNDAPVALQGETTFHTNESRTANLFATDADLPQGFWTDPNFRFEIVSQPAHGTLTRVNQQYPIYNYVPQTDYAGDDSFTFRAFDGQAYSNTATFSFKNVGAIPAARADSFTAPLTNSVSIAAPGLLANDTQSNASKISGAINVSSGSVTINADGSFTWTAGVDGPPASNIVNFQYYLSDPYYTSAPATVTLRLVPLSAQSQTLAALEDVPRPVRLNVSGATNPTYTISKVPEHGTVSGTAPDLTYTPDRDFNGTDSFEFTVSDSGRTATGTISLTVDPVNDAPSASDVTLASDEDETLDVVLPASDVEGDALTYEIVHGPSVGTLVAGTTPGTYTFTPPANFYGPVFFSWRAKDGTAYSREAQGKIDVAPVNDAPVAESRNLSTDEDKTVPLPLFATDVDDTTQTLTFKITKAPTHGQLVGEAPTLFYRPDANWSGTDSLEFTVNDGELDSTPATVTIMVKPVNDAPTAQTQTVSGDEDTNIDVTLSGSDIEGSALTFKITRQPAHGTLKQEGSNVVYRAFDDWNGTDSFGFVTNDGELDSEEATVTVVVRPVSDAPIARADAYSTDEDTPLSIAAPGVLSNDTDVDGETLTAVLKTQPDNGDVALGANGGFTYTPDADWNGTDSFTYAVSDGTLESAPVTVTITVTAVNDAPVARADQSGGIEDTALAIASSTLIGNDFDAEGDALSVSSVTQPAHGTLSATTGGYLYTPAANWNGTDKFNYTLSDGQATSQGTVTLKIAAVNDAPVAEAQTISLDEDVATVIVLGGSDVDGDALTFAVTSQPTNGTLSGAAPNLTYTPKANWSGTDSFTFSVSDASGAKSTATVSLSVKPVNDAPVATPLALTTTASTPKSFSVSANASDVDGDALTFAIKTAPANGTVTSQGGSSFTYTPRLAFVGNDSFAISATDPSGASATIQVSVTVNLLPAPNRAPSTQGSNLSVLEDGSLTFNLVASDPDGDALTYIIVQNPQAGTLTSKGGASFSFVPPANYFGTQTFTFQVRDARGATSNISTVQLRTVAVNDAPNYDLASTAITVAKNSNVFQQSGFARNLNVGGLPYEQGQVLTFSLQNSNTALFDQQPAISSDGTLVFRPRNGKTGTATITVSARDNGGTSDGGKDTAPTKTFTITIR